MGMNRAQWYTRVPSPPAATTTKAGLLPVIAGFGSGRLARCVCVCA